MEKTELQHLKDEFARLTEKKDSQVGLTPFEKLEYEKIKIKLLIRHFEENPPKK